jgi:hypothetical protein
MSGGWLPYTDVTLPIASILVKSCIWAGTFAIASMEAPLEFGLDMKYKW